MRIFDEFDVSFAPLLLHSGCEPTKYFLRAGISPEIHTLYGIFQVSKFRSISAISCNTFRKYISFLNASCILDAYLKELEIDSVSVGCTHIAYLYLHRHMLS